jgi:hypothetical protein
MRTDFRPDGGADRTTMLQTPDTAILRATLPGIATGGSYTWEGGPWRSLALVTDWSLDAFEPPEILGAGSWRRDLAVYLDDDRELWPWLGYFHRGLGPFRKVRAVDTRSGGFVPLDVRLLVTNDPEFWFWCRAWI